MTFARVLVYFTSSVFMFLAGNIQNWLTPWLKSHQFPDWLTDSFGFLAILFVFATLFNMWFVGKFTPKEPNELKEKEKQKIIKRETTKHTRAMRSLDGEHKKQIKDTVKSECDKVRADLSSEIYNLKDECGRKQITIDVLSTELAKNRQEKTPLDKDSVNNKIKRTPETAGEEKGDLDNYNVIFTSVKEGKNS